LTKTVCVSVLGKHYSDTQIQNNNKINLEIQMYE